MLESVSPFRVLIVDTSDTVRCVRGGALLAAGAGRYVVLQAGETGEALRLCRDENPACLVLAHRPPQFDAGEFLAHLRKENASFDAPVVLVGDGSAWEVAGTSGVEAVLEVTEPSGGRLAWTIGKAIETAEMRRALQQRAAEEERRADALHDAEERFSSFMRALAAGAWIRDLDGAYVFANQTLAFAMNRKVDQIIGQKSESSPSARDGRPPR